MYMGDYIAIEHQIGPFEFACESVSTGTPFVAIVDEDKREIFKNMTFPDQHPSALSAARFTNQVPASANSTAAW
jgi:hypothetical protein